MIFSWNNFRICRSSGFVIRKLFSEKFYPVVGILTNNYSPFDVSTNRQYNDKNLSVRTPTRKKVLLAQIPASSWYNEKTCWWDTNKGNGKSAQKKPPQIRDGFFKRHFVFKNSVSQSGQPPALNSPTHCRTMTTL